MPWRSWKLGLKGCAVWAYADTGWVPNETSAWNDFDGKGPDFAVIYDLATAPPGISQAEKIIPNRRWEAWREGLQDYAWLYLLRQKIEEAKKKGVKAAWIAQGEKLVGEKAFQAAFESVDTRIYDRLRDEMLELLSE